MSSEIIRLPRVTKLELIRLRRRLALARRFHRILRDRMTLLLQEFYFTLKRIAELREELNSVLKELYADYFSGASTYSIDTLLALAAHVPTVEVIVGSRNTAGVAVPVVEIVKSPQSTALLPVDFSDVQTRGEKILNLILQLSEYERAAILIGNEILKTRRRVVMLEKILIPRLIATIKYLTMKFDEMEREEKARSIKIKQRLSSRRWSYQ